MSKKESKEKQVKETKKETRKENLWTRFMNFCHGVKTESKRIHWTEKKDLGRYTVATFAFVLFFSLFFYLVNVIYALVQSLLG